MKELSKIEEILLLSILELGDKAYGFRIRHHISEILDKDFTYGNLYSALDRMTKKQYVEKRRGEATLQRQGKIRIYYTLSARGRKALKDAYQLNLKMWARFRGLVQDL